MCSRQNVGLYNTDTCVTYTQTKVFSGQKCSYPEELQHDIAQTRETEFPIWELDLTRSVPRLSTQETSM